VVSRKTENVLYELAIVTRLGSRSVNIKFSLNANIDADDKFTMDSHS
jgi:hypothetical protein